VASGVQLKERCAVIEFSLEARIGRVVINRPQASNAFTGAMTQQLLDAIRSAADTADIVTIEAKGPDFTIGRDRNEPKPATPLPFYDTFKVISDLNKAISTFPGLIVTAARGRTFGFAVGMLMRSDIAIIGDDCRFVLDEVRHGFPPTFIMEEILQHLPMKRALDVVVSGREWDAKEALDMGLVSRIVPSAQLDRAVNDLVAELKQRNRRAVLACKHYMRTVAAMPPEARSAYALVETVRYFESK
jgi:methylglutaconyl-CoA hydratase